MLKVTKKSRPEGRAPMQFVEIPNELEDNSEAIMPRKFMGNVPCTTDMTSDKKCPSNEGALIWFSLWCRPFTPTVQQT
jgi:hypothetical protein